MNNYIPQLLFADTEPLYDNDCYEKYYEMIPDFRKKQLESYRFKKDKILSVASWILVLKAFEMFGIDASNKKPDYNKYGKPCFNAFPDIEFNISHSNKKAICIIADSNVGCDVQLIKNINLHIAERYFTKQECKYIFSQNTESEKNDAFHRIWTLKESFIKALGIGMSISLSSFSVIPNENNVILIQNHNKNNYNFREFDFKDGYKYSFCSDDSLDNSKVNFIKL